MLTKLLIHLFVRERKNPASPVARLQFGMLAGIVGIAVNILLTVVKMSIGFLSGSVSVAADAVNNLSDAGASVVTVIGFKLAARPADNGHPFGHGRLEYIA
ncbi:MAG: cation transporter, partial [Lentisphaeria bacterium]|nr:cation transporter [Lentisphaeria bacterium]